MRVIHKINSLFSLITPKDLTKGVKISTIVHLGLLFLCIISPLIIPHKYKSFRPTMYTVQLVNLPGVKIQQTGTVQPVMPKPPAPKVQEPAKQQKTETKTKEPIVQKKPEMVIPQKTAKKIIPREKTPNLAEKLSKRFKEFDSKTPTVSQKEWTEPANTVPIVSGSLGSSGTLGLSTPSDFPFQWYLELIHGKISSCWTSPQMTIDKKYSAIISFTITKTGGIININVKRSSGISNFDQSGIKAIELAKPFPELPPGYAYSQLTVNVEFALE